MSDTKCCSRCKLVLPAPEFFRRNRSWKLCNKCNVKGLENRRKLYEKKGLVLHTIKFHTIEECRKIAASRGGECLEDGFSHMFADMRWRCGAKHEWKARFASILGGKWCRQCAGTAPHTLEHCKKVAAGNGGECLETKYLNGQTLMGWRCGVCNHEWKASFENVKNRKSWCPMCSCQGRSEKLTREIFEEVVGLPFLKFRPAFAQGLEPDGFCEEIGLAFEYHGRQHYMRVPHWHKREEDFQQQLRRDEILRRLCSENGVTLIEVPYTLSYQDPKKLRGFIIDQLVAVKILVSGEFS